MSKLDPSMDGIDHINVYSKGATRLGQFLSNFAHTPIETIDGHFESVEGYWYWLGTRNDELRKLHGYEAKKFGRKLERTHPLYEEEFRGRIKKALDIKLENNPEFLEELRSSDLPLKHYYVMRGRITVPPNNKWIIDHIEYIRRKKHEIE